MSDLELLLDRPNSGRAAPPHGSLVRDLTEADLHALQSAKPGALNQRPRTVAKIRHTHHTLARLLAAGIKHEEISRITGYSPSYISTISSQDPAFKNLIQYYADQISGNFTEVHVTLHERLTAISMLASEELLDRLTSEPEEFSANELNELVKSSADRTGFGPQTKNTNLNVNVDIAARLESARARAFGPPTLDTGGQEVVPVDLLPSSFEDK